MTGKEKEPEVRFRGYINEWENRELSNLLVLLKDGTHGTHKDVKDGAYLLSAKNIKDGEIYIDDSDRKISFEEFQKIHSHFTLQKGDVLVTIVGTIGETAIMGNIENITFQRSVAYLRTSCKLYNYFLFYEIATQRFQFELENRRSVSAQPGIYLGELARIPINYPGDITEQEKIGRFFNALDNIITLQQQKYNQLVNMKQTLLEKMFPHDGAKAPEIRLDGFFDSWEHYTLEETNTYFTDGNYGEAYPKSSDMRSKDEGVPFLTGSNLKNGALLLDGASFISKAKHLQLTSGHLKYDDIVIAVRGSIGALGYVSRKNVGWNINSQLAIIRTNKKILRGDYLIQYLMSGEAQASIKSKNSGSALKQLPISQLKDINIPIPSLAEQEDIAEFFQKIDNLINFQKKKTDQLKNIKQSFLDKIFVS